MGKGQSKETEVVIAQNGANNARIDQTETEKKMEIYNIVIVIGVVILITFAVYMFCKNCRKSIKKWLRKEFVCSLSASQAAIAPQTDNKVQQHPQQQAQYA